MAFGGDVDTLSLTFDKLQYIFNGYGQIREAFLEANSGNREGSVPEREFYGQVLEAVLRFSALEFLAIKSVFEIKKALDRGPGVAASDGGPAGLAGTMQPPSRSLESFITAGTLPRPETGRPEGGPTRCRACGNQLKSTAAYCAKCGAKV